MPSIYLSILDGCPSLKHMSAFPSNCSASWIPWLLYNLLLLQTIGIVVLGHIQDPSRPASVSSTSQKQTFKKSIRTGQTSNDTFVIYLQMQLWYVTRAWIIRVYKVDQNLSHFLLSSSLAMRKCGWFYDYYTFYQHSRGATQLALRKKILMKQESCLESHYDFTPHGILHCVVNGTSNGCCPQLWCASVRGFDVAKLAGESARTSTLVTGSAAAWSCPPGFYRYHHPVHRSL